MLRSSLLFGAVAAAMPLIAFSASGASAASVGNSLDVPTAITQWFHENGAEAAQRDALEMIGEDQLLHGAKDVSLGEPLAKILPVNVQYDLKNDQVVGTAQLTESDLVVSEYCAIAKFGEAASGILECAELDDSGKVVESSAGTLSKPVTSELHLDALVQYDFVGTLGIDMDDNTFVALEADAAEALGGTTVDVATFLTAEGKRWAQSEAIQRLNGPQEGGGGDLSLNLSSSQEAERDALVAQALALPEDLAWHDGDDFDEILKRRQAAAGAAAANASSSAGTATETSSSFISSGALSPGRTWAAAVLSVVTVAGLLWAVIARRLSRRQATTGAERAAAGSDTPKPR